MWRAAQKAFEQGVGKDAAVLRRSVALASFSHLEE
jgi:hypothetical protein